MAPDLPKKLAAEGVHAAPRLGRLRISPHVYNDEQDVERFVEVFARSRSRSRSWRSPVEGCSPPPRHCLPWHRPRAGIPSGRSG
jgi:hypothetical protein